MIKKLKIFSLVTMLFLTGFILNQCSKPNDTNISRDIKAQLVWDSRVDAANINVTVNDRVATLTGTVPFMNAKIAAEEDAWNIPGVISVINNIKVKFPVNLSIPSDEVLKTRIQNIYAWDSSIDITDVNVSILGGIVTLKGSVNQLWKKDYAEKVIRPMTGVIAVNNQLNVVPTDNFLDKEIAKNIKNALQRNSDVNAENVNIIVKNGKVTLDGNVSDNDAKNEAYFAAILTLGVTDVNNDLTISS